MGPIIANYLGRLCHVHGRSATCCSTSCYRAPGKWMVGC